MSKQAGTAETTVANYEVNCRLHLVPFFGNRYLSDIRPKHIDDYLQERAKAAQHTSVNLELFQRKAILNTAVRWGYLK